MVNLNKKVEISKSLVAKLFVVGFVTVALTSCSTIIETGERGVILRLGKYTGIMDEGFNFKMPIDHVIKMSVRDQKYNAKAEVSSSDMQTILVVESLVYSIDPKHVGDIYKKYQLMYENILIRPILAEVTNSVIAAYPIERFVEKRSEISNKIKAEFERRVEGTGIIVKSFSLVNHDFSDEYNKAIEAKKVAEQGALKAKYDLERVTLEAEAQLKKQKSLNEMVLMEKAIDKWDGKMPQYYSGEGLPFISTQKLGK